MQSASRLIFVLMAIVLLVQLVVVLLAAVRFRFGVVQGPTLRKVLIVTCTFMMLAILAEVALGGMNPG